MAMRQRRCPPPSPPPKHGAVARCAPPAIPSAARSLPCLPCMQAYGTWEEGGAGRICQYAYFGREAATAAVKFSVQDVGGSGCGTYLCTHAHACTHTPYDEASPRRQPCHRGGIIAHTAVPWHLLPSIPTPQTATPNHDPAGSWGGGLPQGGARHVQSSAQQHVLEGRPPAHALPHLPVSRPQGCPTQL